MDKMVLVMGRMTLNPNAAEFIPAALKPSPNVQASGSTNRRVWNRTDSANSGTSDDESRQYWKDQLPDDIIPVPDDIIPDFGIVQQAGDDRFAWEHGCMEEYRTILEAGEGIDPMDLLVNEFPSFAEQSLADVLSANGGDLNLTIEMLTQLELQDDTGPVQQLQTQTPKLNMMDFPALAGPEFADRTSQFDGDINAQHSLRTRQTIGVEDLFTSRSYASGGDFRAAATDFAAAVRKNAAAAAQWQTDRNGHIERDSHAEDFPVTNGEKQRSFSSSRSHSPPVWLETGETVSTMYVDLREEARDHARVRNAYFEQARQAYLAGNKALAKELSAKGQWHNGLMKDAHSKAGEAIFQQRNLSTGVSSQGQPQLLDLHGLHVNEAIPLLKRELAALRAAGRSTQQRQQVLICVGTGHHTKGFRTPARLPIAVEKFLAEDEHLPFTEQQPGMLRVVLS